MAGAGEQCAEAERKAASTVQYCTVQYSPCNLTLVKDKRRPAGASYIVWGTSWQPTPGPSLLLLGHTVRQMLFIKPIILRKDWSSSNFRVNRYTADFYTNKTEVSE